MFSQNNEPVNENEPEQAVPAETVGVSAETGGEPVEPVETTAAIETGIDAGSDTPALGEHQSRQFADLINRVGELTSAIEQFPDSPANYVLRGEMFLEGGDNDLAAADFEMAIQLAGQQAEAADWGYIYRALADRAREGLRRA